MKEYEQQATILKWTIASALKDAYNEGFSDGILEGGSEGYEQGRHDTLEEHDIRTDS